MVKSLDLSFAVQAWIVRIAVGASTTRGQGERKGRGCLRAPTLHRKGEVSSSNNAIKTMIFK